MQQQRERAAQLGCFQGSPRLSPSFALQAHSGRRGSELAAAVPCLGKPTRQHSLILTLSLPAPWHHPAPRQAPLSGRSGRGHRLLCPTAAPPPLPWALIVSRPLFSPLRCPPQPGRTVPQRPKGTSPRSQGLGLPAQQNLPVQQGWAPTPAARGYRLPKRPCCTLAFGRESEPGFQPRPIPTEGGLRKPRGSSSANLCWLPHAAAHPPDRVTPRPCYHPNVTPWAGAARFVPTRLAAARPRCLPCWLLVSLVPQGAFGGPLASSLGALSARHLWAKTGSPLSSSPSAAAVWPAQAKTAPAAAPRRPPQQERACPGQQPHSSCGLLPHAPQGCAGGQL